MPQDEKTKRVLIAMPTLGIDPDPDRWLNSLFRILNNVRREGFEHACFFPYRKTWWEANNEIWNVAFQHKFDYILRLDDDIHGVGDESFSDLLNAGKDVIGAAYHNRRFPYNVQALNRTKDVSFIEAYEDSDHCFSPVVSFGFKDIDVREVELIGFGMTLIRVAPFRWLERPMYKGNEVCPDDSYFAQICFDNGIKQHVHLGVRINHAHVTPANAGHLFNADVIQVAEKEQDEESKNAKVEEKCK